MKALLMTLGTTEYIAIIIFSIVFILGIIRSITFLSDDSKDKYAVAGVVFIAWIILALTFGGLIYILIKLFPYSLYAFLCFVGFILFLDAITILIRKYKK